MLLYRIKFSLLRRAFFTRTGQILRRFSTCLINCQPSWLSRFLIALAVACHQVASDGVVSVMSVERFRKCTQVKVAIHVSKEVCEAKSMKSESMHSETTAIYIHTYKHTYCVYMSTSACHVALSSFCCPQASKKCVDATKSTLHPFG